MRRWTAGSTCSLVRVPVGERKTSVTVTLLVPSAWASISASRERSSSRARSKGTAINAPLRTNTRCPVGRYCAPVPFTNGRRSPTPMVTASPAAWRNSAVRRLTSHGTKKVGLLTGHGEPGLNELQRAQEALRRQYELTTVDVSKAQPVPADIAVLVVMAPSSRIPDPQKFQIDQYLMRGGRVAFLLNKVEANLQSPYGRPVDLNLDDMLAAYALRENADLVRDAQCASPTERLQFAPETDRAMDGLPAIVTRHPGVSARAWLTRGLLRAVLQGSGHDPGGANCDQPPGPAWRNSSA